MLLPFMAMPSRALSFLSISYLDTSAINQPCHAPPSPDTVHKNIIRDCILFLNISSTSFSWLPTTAKAEYCTRLIYTLVVSGLAGRIIHTILAGPHRLHKAMTNNTTLSQAPDLSSQLYFRQTSANSTTPLILFTLLIKLVEPRHG